MLEKILSIDEKFKGEVECHFVYSINSFEKINHRERTFNGLTKLKLLKLKQISRSPVWLSTLADGGITAPFAVVLKSKRHEMVTKENKNVEIRIAFSEFTIFQFYFKLKWDQVNPNQ